MRRARLRNVWEEQRGYTLAEVMTAVAIAGVLLAISIIILLALLERWRVEAAASQLAADMRLAHTNATNGLTDWRLILAPAEVDADSDEDAVPDYFLIRLKAVCPAACSNPRVVESRPRSFPVEVRIEDHRSATSNDDQSEPRWASPLMPGDAGTVPVPTRTVEFNSDGTMAFFEGPANSACITEDGAPTLRVKAGHPSTSNVEIEDGSGHPCDVD